LTRVVGTPVGRRLPAASADGKVEILGVAGAGKSTVARLLGRVTGVEMAEFIHTRQPSHLLEVARALPRLLPLLLGGVARRPRISWPEVKLLVYVTRWRRFLGRRGRRPGTILLFDQGPLYALVRLKAEGKPFADRRAFETWTDEMLEGWARELGVVVWLDAPDDVLWSRINERSQGHKKKGEDVETGHDFIVRYRRCFEDVLHRMEDLDAPPQLLRFDTSTSAAEQIADTVIGRLRPERSTGDHRVSRRDGDRHGR
jgi:broad-specificity NMP kinase